MLLEKILEAQRGDQNCMLDLIRAFQQLLHKYTYKSHYEDALDDLVTSLVEVAYKVRIEDFPETSDGALVNYITQSINHTYFKLSKRINILSSKEQHIDDLTESQQFYMENTPAPEGEHLSKFKLMLSRCNLVNAEKEVIIKFFFWETLVDQIVKKMKVPCQNVNQVKNHTIKKLRKIYG